MTQPAVAEKATPVEAERPPVKTGKQPPRKILYERLAAPFTLADLRECCETYPELRGGEMTVAELLALCGSFHVRGELVVR